MLGTSCASYFSIEPTKVVRNRHSCEIQPSLDKEGRRETHRKCLASGNFLYTPSFNTPAMVPSALPPIGILPKGVDVDDWPGCGFCGW